MAIIRKRNKLTALMWGKLNLWWGKDLCEQAESYNGTIATGNTRDGSWYFYFWKRIFKNITVLYSLQKQSIWIRKERENISFASLKVPSCIYSNSTCVQEDKEGRKEASQLGSPLGDMREPPDQFWKLAKEKSQALILVSLWTALHRWGNGSLCRKVFPLVNKDWMIKLGYFYFFKP